MKLIKKDNVYYLSHDFKDLGSTEDCGLLGKLSLKNCQAIENGYDLDELDKLANVETRKYLPGCAENIITFITHKAFFKKAFQMAKLLGDKKFSELINKQISNFTSDLKKSTSTYTKQNYEGAIFGLKRLKQSLQQTEFDVEILMGKEMKQVDVVEYGTGELLSSRLIPVNDNVPMLDKDGCLILKKI